MSTATQGRAREYKVRDELIGHGWHFIMRAAASKGSGDLLMGHPHHGAALVQVGTGSKTLGPADRDRFVTDADLIGALPILATVIPREPIRYHHVNRGTSGTWDRFDPRGTA